MSAAARAVIYGKTDTPPERNIDARFRKARNPVAKRVVVIEADDYYAVPGRFGMAWDYIKDGEVNAPYDPESMAIIRRMGGVARLVDIFCPRLSGDRRQRLIDRIESICHAKQRAHMTDEPEHRARRLTKAERRAKRK